MKLRSVIVTQLNCAHMLYDTPVLRLKRAKMLNFAGNSLVGLYTSCNLITTSLRPRHGEKTSGIAENWSLRARLFKASPLQFHSSRNHQSPKGQMHRIGSQQ